MGLAALVRYAEARRPARLDGNGVMVRLSDQDPALRRRPLIESGNLFLYRARNLGAVGYRALTAAIHGVWCARRSLADPAPWPAVLELYDAMLRERDDVVVRLNRAVAAGGNIGSAGRAAGSRASRESTARRLPAVARRAGEPAAAGRPPR